MADQNTTLPPLYTRSADGSMQPLTAQQLQQLQAAASSQVSPADNPLSSESSHQVVHVSRPLNPAKPEISAEARRKYEASKQRYPFLNLSEGEFVILAVSRHPIGLFPIWGTVGLLASLTVAGMLGYAGNRPAIAALAPLFSSTLPSVGVGAAVLLGLLGLFVLGGGIAAWVYAGNKFFLTNESVIQIIRYSLFSTNEQTVSLGNIEDASYTQRGLAQSLFNYGSLRLSTEGDETTYRFSYVSNPKSQVAVLNNAVEAFKNGRPVD